MKRRSHLLRDLPTDVMRPRSRRPMSWPIEAPADPELTPATRKVGFDVTGYGAVTLAAAKPAAGTAVEVYRSDPSVNHTEITALGLQGIPLAVYHNMLSWAWRLDGGGVQEFVTGSNVAGANKTLRDAGFRWAPYGSLHHPQPIRIILKRDQRLQWVLLDYTDVTNFPDVRVTVHFRVQGIQHFVTS